MLDWCLTETLRPKGDLAYGEFAEVDEYSTVEKYAFGIGFLEVVGFWAVAEPFWWDPSQRRERRWPAA